VDSEAFDPSEFMTLAGAVPWVVDVVCHEEADSTNAEALRLASAGAPAGTIVVADTQTAGRGRLGRSWWSEPGTALLASWLLRPALEPERLPLLSLLAGVAAARAASAAGGITVGLKWPNDLVVGGRKLGGILSESDGKGAVVVGLGLNVRQTEFPDDLVSSATSIVEAGGRAPSRAWVLAATLSSFGARMDAPEGALDDYRAMCVSLGRVVRVELSSGDAIEGTATDVTPSGALVVEGATGARIVSSGDVEHLRPSG
jgi:BirA family transcriptional regulator, biotin operon repressor / biotin---[acetyl-CoA-carboxylase] ligase